MPKRRRQEGTSLIPSNLHVPEDCRAVSEVLARVGDKWTVLVVSTLGDGPKRFNELRRALGSIPPRIDYALTKLGHSLLEPVSSLGLWARQNRAAIHDARRRFDAARSRRVD